MSQFKQYSCKIHIGHVWKLCAKKIWWFIAIVPIQWLGVNCSLHPGDLGLLNNLPVDLQQLLDSVIPASNHETSRALGLETTENQRNFSKFYPSWLWFQSEWYKKLLEASTFKTKPPILPPVEDHWTYGNSLKLSILPGTFHLQQKTQYHLNFPSSALNCLISLLARHGWWSSKALGKTFAEQQEHDGQQKWEFNGENTGIQWDNDGLIMGYMCILIHDFLKKAELFPFLLK